MYIGIEKSIQASWIPPIALWNGQIRREWEPAENLQESALRTLSLKPVREKQREDEAVKNVCVQSVLVCKP
jgi:hypothetical protein